MSWISWKDAADRVGHSVGALATCVRRSTWVLSWSRFDPVWRPPWKDSMLYSQHDGDAVERVVTRVVGFPGDPPLRDLAPALDFPDDLARSTHVSADDLEKLTAALAAELVASRGGS